MGARLSQLVPGHAFLEKVFKRWPWPTIALVRRYLRTKSATDHLLSHSIALLLAILFDLATLFYSPLVLPALMAALFAFVAPTGLRRTGWFLLWLLLHILQLFVSVFKYYS